MPDHDRPAQALTLGYLVPLAWWLGGVLAAVELLAVVVLRLTTERFLWVSPQILWMTPAGFVLGLTVLAVPLALLGRWWPRLATPVVVVTALAWPAFVSILLVYPRLSSVAIAILATGLSVQSARWIAGRPSAFRHRVRRTGWWVLVAVAAIALGQNGVGWASERMVVGRLPTLSAPNILVIILDTVRAANVSVYGYARRTTPNLEALAGRGVVFDRSIAPSSWTLPSHATAFTGRPLHEHGASWRTPLAAQYPTLAEALQRQGYDTGGFVANILYCGYETGLNRGFIHYEDYRVSWGEFALGTAIGRTVSNHPLVRRILHFDGIVDRKDGATITRDFLDWQAGRERPFFAFLNYLDAHEPYAAPAEFEKRFGSVDARLGGGWYQHQLRVSVLTGRRSMSDEANQAELNAYDGAIAYLDDQVGALLDTLAARGVLDNTIVVVASDHGEHFGEHGKFGHGDGLYLPAIHVPLLVAYGSNLPAGRRVEDAVGLDDLPATIWDLAGLDAPLPFPGQSLVATWSGTGGASPPRRPVRSEFIETAGMPVMTSLVTDGYQYIHTTWPDSVTEELYDIDRDPDESRNLTGNPDQAARLEQLRRLVDPTR